MNSFKNIIYSISLYLIISCNFQSSRTYYCKGLDLHLRIVEKDSIDILIFDETDSILIPSRKGQYIGLQFFIKKGSDSLFFELTPSVPVVYKYVENKYKIKFVQFEDFRKDYSDQKLFYAAKNMIYRNAGTKYVNPYLGMSKATEEFCFDNRYWGFYGDSDQGRYTISAVRDSAYYEILEPL